MRLWLNSGNGTFSRRMLPVEAQFAPAHALLVDDFTSDAVLDILIGGNLLRAKPETGVYAGSYGLLLKGDSEGNFSSIPADELGLSIQGEIRSFRKISSRGKNMYLSEKIIIAYKYWVLKCKKMRMNRILLFCFEMAFGASIISCDKNKFFGASATKNYDSLFLALYLGMDRQAFFDRCWELSNKQIATNGGSAESVLYVLETELDHRVNMEFYPVFYR